MTFGELCQSKLSFVVVYTVCALKSRNFSERIRVAGLSLSIGGSCCLADVLTSLGVRGWDVRRQLCRAETQFNNWSTAMSKRTPSSISERNIRRHPIHKFREQLKKGEISELPQLGREFIVAVPQHEDFIVRLRQRGAPPIEARFHNSGGKACGHAVFSDPEFEIELIGTNEQRSKRAVAEKRKTRDA